MLTTAAQWGSRTGSWTNWSTKHPPPRYYLRVSKVTKHGSAHVEDITEASGIRFIKKNWEKLKLSGQKVMEIKYEEASYYGQVKVNSNGEAIRQGLGSMYYTSGRYYEGYWSEGLRQGKGFEKFEIEDASLQNSSYQSKSNIYDGDYHEGKAHGKGIYRWHNGEVYTGDWKEGLRDGNGQWIATNNESYQGDWVGGKPHGYGVYNWENGNLVVIKLFRW